MLMDMKYPDAKKSRNVRIKGMDMAKGLSLGVRFLEKRLMSGL